MHSAPGLLGERALKGSSRVNVNNARAVSHFHVSHSMCLSRASGFPLASVCPLGPSPLTSLARPARLTRLTSPKSQRSSPAQSSPPGLQGRERKHPVCLDHLLRTDMAPRARRPRANPTHYRAWQNAQVRPALLTGTWTALLLWPWPLGIFHSLGCTHQFGSGCIPRYPYCVRKNASVRDSPPVPASTRSPLVQPAYGTRTQCRCPPLPSARLEIPRLS